VALASIIAPLRKRTYRRKRFWAAAGSFRGAVAITGKVLGLGLTFAQKLGVDASLAAAEAGDCAYRTKGRP
jgi:hypothetical protein